DALPISEDETATFERAEEVAAQREARSAHALEEERGSARGVRATLDLGDLEIRVDLLAHANELAVTFEIEHAVAEASVRHRALLLVASARIRAGPAVAPFLVDEKGEQIGRASCRERGTREMCARAEA